MILADPSHPSSPPPAECRMTLGDLFRRAGVRHADVLALVDPPDRTRTIGGRPLQLTYGAADRIVSAIANRLREIGLPTDAIVAFQLPNTAESVLTLLGILRAGMIAAPIPLLWRKTDIIASLAQIGAKALITADRIAGFASIETAMQVAADLFPIRFLCAFGENLPDGVVPLDDLLAAGEDTRMPVVARAGEPSAHLAVITWEVTAGGAFPVARSHAELIAGGLPVSRQMQAGDQADEQAGDADRTILSATPISSFAGLALTLVPWLLSGGTLVLHQGLEPETLSGQSATHRCDTIVVPAPLLGPLAESGFFTGEHIRSVIAFWRSPENLALATPWPGRARLIDVVVIGDFGLVAMRRSGPLPGVVLQSGGPASFVELERSEAGSLLVRGAMTPSQPFPPGPPAQGLPHLQRAQSGHIDTGYRCRFEPLDGTLAITAPPAGIVTVGGYRLARNDVDTIGSLLGPDSTLAVLPNALTGQRLAGTAGDSAALADLLASEGINALIAAAFRPSRDKAA